MNRTETASKPIPGRGWASPAKIAEYLDVHPETIRRLIRSGRLPCRRVGRLLRCSWVDVIRYAEGAGRGGDDGPTSETIPPAA